MVRVFSNVPYRLTCVRKLTKNAPQPDRYVLESLGGKVAQSAPKRFCANLRYLKIHNLRSKTQIDSTITALHRDQRRKPVLDRLVPDFLDQ